MACLLQQGMFSSTVFSANEPLHLVGPACSKEHFPSTETLLPPACLVNIFTPDPPKKLRGAQRGDWLSDSRRRLTDWSEAQCQSRQARAGVEPKNMTQSPVGKKATGQKKRSAFRACHAAWMASIAFCWLCCFGVQAARHKNARNKKRNLSFFHSHSIWLQRVKRYLYNC